MKYRKRFYLCLMVAITVLFFRSFPKLDISTWSLLLMTAEESSFLRTWCRIQCAQLDVNQLLGSCKACVHNTGYTRTSCGHRKSSEAATNVKYSYLSWQLIRPAGHFSHLFITTKNSSGCAKSIGGDHWKVSLKGPSILRAFVFDLGNGSYEAVLLPREAGRYRVDIILVYSLCKGLMNTAWTESQGSRDLGKIEHYIDIPSSKEEPLLHRLQYHMKFHDCFDASGHHYQTGGWRRRCVFLWNGDGTWENVRGELKWRPYIKIDDRPRKVDYRKRGAVRKNGTLWFYGDRHSQIFHSVIHRPLCKKIFKNCEEVTTFYQPELQDLTKLSVENIIELVLNSLRLLLRHSIQQSENALILNSNFIGHLPYRSYTVIVDEIAKLLLENSNSSVHAQIVWSTMTSSLPYSHVYNAYTNQKMCNINIPILDIFPLTDSHPHYIHSSKETNTSLELIFESVERLLEDFFEQTANR